METNFLEGLFDLTRTENPHSNQARIKTLLVEKDLTLSQVAAKVLASDRTGYKEVLGNLTKITGYGFEEMGIEKNIIPKLAGFGNQKSNPSKKKEWDAIQTIEITPVVTKEPSVEMVATI